MKDSKNHVQLIGLACAPIVRETPEGLATRFSLATTEKWTGENGEKVTETQWHNIICFGKIAKIAAKMVIANTEIEVQGKLSNRSYIDKEGIKKFITEVVIEQLLIISRPKSPAEKV